MPSLRVMTISPSLEAKIDYARIRELLKRGVRVALGHDVAANEADILGALRIGQLQKKNCLPFKVCLK